MSGSIGSAFDHRHGAGIEAFVHLHDGDAASLSPAMMARWMGAAPRQRGSSEACTLKQPSRGASRTGFRQYQAIGDDHRGIGPECAEFGLRLVRLSDFGVSTVSPRRRASRSTGVG